MTEHFSDSHQKPFGFTLYTKSLVCCTKIIDQSNSIHSLSFCITVRPPRRSCTIYGDSRKFVILNWQVRVCSYEMPLYSRVYEKTKMYANNDKSCVFHVHMPHAVNHMHVFGMPQGSVYSLAPTVSGRC